MGSLSYPINMSDQTLYIKNLEYVKKTLAKIVVPFTLSSLDLSFIWLLLTLSLKIGPASSFEKHSKPTLQTQRPLSFYAFMSIHRLHGFSFNLSEEDFHHLGIKTCSLCGIWSNLSILLHHGYLLCILIKINLVHSYQLRLEQINFSSHFLRSFSY